MVAINIGISKLRAFPLRLKVVGGIIALDLGVLLLGYMVLDDVMAERAALVERTRVQLADAKRQSMDLKKQVDSYPQLRRQYDEAIEAGLTTSLDRQDFVQFAQGEAGRHYLSDLRFRLSDEPGDHEHSARYRVDIDRIIFENGGLLDTEAISFWAAVLAQAKGHYRLAEASIERVQDIDPAVLSAIRHGNPVTVLRAKIDMQWIGVRPLNQEAKQ